MAWLTQRKIFKEWQQLLNNLLNVASNLMDGILWNVENLANVIVWWWIGFRNEKLVMQTWSRTVHYFSTVYPTNHLKNVFTSCLVLHITFGDPSHIIKVLPELSPFLSQHCSPPPHRYTLGKGFNWFSSFLPSSLPLSFILPSFLFPSFFLSRFYWLIC